MRTEIINISLKDKIIDLFESKKQIISSNDSSAISNLREEAIRKFQELGFPHGKIEGWRNTNLSKAIERNYHLNFEPAFEDNMEIKKIFKCNIPQFDTTLIPLLNGWYVQKGNPLITLPDGTIYGSMAKAMEIYPELFVTHFSKYANFEKNGLNALNTAFYQDGVFIYVPDNVNVNKPLQMVSILNINENLMVNTRNLVILGKNSSLTLIHCDDSIDRQSCFINSLTEVYVGENASIKHYKLQNLNNDTTLINANYFFQESYSRVTTNAITLNGGIIRNDINITIAGHGCDTNVYGVYLADKGQHVDNEVFIDHAAPNSNSNQLFKGIIDDYASAVFGGHVLVRKDSQKTKAHQTNKNILLTDKAKVNAKPFLEIYADDVKCSHGATVGQLDEEALFYLRSRGIGEDNARLLLMYAFAAEVIDKISIEALRIRVDDMVKKRLRGELSICEQCVLHCSTQEKPVEFAIDLSLI